MINKIFKEKYENSDDKYNVYNFHEYNIYSTNDLWELNKKLLIKRLQQQNSFVYFTNDKCLQLGCVF